MVKFKDGSNYLEIGIFDALFLPERTLARKKALIKRQKEAKAKKAADGPAGPASASPPADAAAAPAAPADQAAEPAQPPDPPAEPAPAPAPAAVADAAVAAAPVAEAAAPAPAPTQAPAQDPAGLAGIEVLAEVVQSAAPTDPAPAPADPAPAAPAALPGKGEWNDAKVDKLCSMAGECKSWEIISTELGETIEDVIKKFSQLPEEKRKVLQFDSGDWNEKLDEMLWGLKSEQSKSWAYISAAMLRETKECQEKFKELKEKRNGGNKDGGNGGKGGKGGKGGGNNNNNDGGGKDNGGGNKKGKEKEKADDGKPEDKEPDPESKPDEPESKPDASLPNGKFPRISGDFIDEETMSSYDPDGPPASGPRGFVDRYDDSQPLKDEQGHLLGQEEMDYLVKLAHYYDNQKWMDVASRFFDETGRRVPWGQLKQKLGNLKFP